MYVAGIGNVTECNRQYIHLNNEGKQERIAANEERLEAIRSKAAKDVTFYDRLWEEIHAQYELRYEEVKRKYHFIKKEDIEAELKKGNVARYWDMKLSQDSHNEECIRQYSKVFGWADVCSYASDNKWAAYKILKQSEDALQRINKAKRK